MWPYQRGYSWDDDFADAATRGVAGLAVLAAAVFATLLIILSTELARIYIEHGGKHSPVARVLWIALGVFLVVVLLAGLLATNAALTAPAMYLAAWSFLAFVIVVEGAALHAQREEQGQLESAGELDTYLDRDWSTSATASPDGRSGLAPAVLG